MSPTDQKVPATAAVVEKESNGRVYASRDEILSAAGRFAEEEHDVEGIGWVMLSEISGEARARILGRMGMALEDGKLTDSAWTGHYQRALLLAGVVDPSSPEGARLPLLREGDLDRLMKLGGAKVTDMVTVIERLSKMGRFQESAEKNSVPIPSAVSTSG